MPRTGDAAAIPVTSRDGAAAVRAMVVDRHPLAIQIKYRQTKLSSRKQSPAAGNELAAWCYGKPVQWTLPYVHAIDSWQAYSTAEDCLEYRIVIIHAGTVWADVTRSRY